jgi:hypothetical protein
MVCQNKIRTASSVMPQAALITESRQCFAICCE